MKNIICFNLFATLLLPIYSFSQDKADIRAREGEQAWLIVNYVKPESKQDFEKFMEEIFFDALTTSQAPQRAEQYRKTRWFTPARQNEDGTWTYAFIMDPVVAYADYEIEKLFQEKYSPEKSTELLRQYESFIARSDFHVIVQSRH